MKATGPKLPGHDVLNRYPFRGIYSEIAAEEGVSRQAVQQAARKGSPRILNRIAEKVEERKALLKEKARGSTGQKTGGATKK